MRKIATVVALGLSLMATACNTVKGLGEDVQSVGQEGEDVIND